MKRLPVAQYQGKTQGTSLGLGRAEKDEILQEWSVPLISAPLDLKSLAFLKEMVRFR